MNAELANQRTDVITYTDNGVTIGQMFKIKAGSRTVYLAMARDWHGDDQEYQLVAGVFDDPASGVKEIEEHARQAQAPACSGYWVAEIAPCPDCRRPAIEHAQRPASEV